MEFKSAHQRRLLEKQLQQQRNTGTVIPSVTSNLLNEPTTTTEQRLTEEEKANLESNRNQFTFSPNFEASLKKSKILKKTHSQSTDTAMVKKENDFQAKIFPPKSSPTDIVGMQSKSGSSNISSSSSSGGDGGGGSGSFKKESTTTTTTATTSKKKKNNMKIKSSTTTTTTVKTEEDFSTIVNSLPANKTTTSISKESKIFKDEFDGTLFPPVHMMMPDVDSNSTIEENNQKNVMLISGDSRTITEQEQCLLSSVTFEEGKFYLLQLPASFGLSPSASSMSTSHYGQQHENQQQFGADFDPFWENEQFSPLLELENDKIIGSLQVHRSGKKTLKIGNVEWLLAPGVNIDFQEELAVTMPAGKKSFYLLGDVTKRIIGTPSI